MNVSSQRRMAAQILKVGYYRVWIDPMRSSEVAEAITREDIKRLIEEGVIAVRPERATSRHRARERHIKRVKGSRRGPGKRKGTVKSKVSKKRQWINKVRPMRALLKHLRDRGIIEPSVYADLYRKVKGNMFRSKAHLKLYIREHNLAKQTEAAQGGEA